jgi:hypothetical protein
VNQSFFYQVLFGLGIAQLTAFGVTLPNRPYLAYAHPRSYYEAKVNLAEPEKSRIQKHLAFLEDSLRHNPPDNMAANLLINRESQLQRLHEYWMRGEFPVNRDFSDKLAPYFVDAKGIPCAVGYLLLTSNGEALVRDITQKNNFAYIRDIQDTRFDAWVSRSGLTREECARIQPSYGGGSNYSDVKDLVVDNRDSLWVVAQESGFCMGCSALATWKDKQWRILGAPGDKYQSLVVIDSGKAIIGTRNGLWWRQESYEKPISFLSMIRDTSDASLWAGTDQGLMHFSIQADSTLKRLGAFSPSATSFVINRLSATGKTIWMASAAGVSAFSKANQNWTQWDTTKLRVSRVLDVQGSNGDTLWLGVDGSTRLGSDPIVAFSTKGIWRMHNGVISRYQRNNSALPSDTVYGALAMDNNRIWIVSAGAVYQFTPPNTLKKMADFSNRPGPIARMAVNKRGQLWVGTRGGVFQLQNNVMVAIGNPAVAIGKTVTKRDRFKKQTRYAALKTRSLLGRAP